MKTKTKTFQFYNSVSSGRVYYVRGGGCHLIVSGGAGSSQSEKAAQADAAECLQCLDSDEILA